MDGLSCGFCGKNSKDVSLLIAGPHVHICDECVVLCVSIIAETAKSRAGVAPYSIRPGRTMLEAVVATPSASGDA